MTIRFKGKILLSVLLLLPCSDRVNAEDAPASVILTLENDFFGGTDRHYTHGTRLAFLQQEGVISGSLSRMLDFALLDLKNPKKRWGITLGQSIYTPENLRVPGLIPVDRPYAGWLYGGLILQRRGTEFNEAVDVQDHFEMNLGVIGPSAMAKETQTFVHRSVGAVIPQGWGNQIRDEPGLVLKANRAYRITTLKKHRDTHLSADIIPDVGFTVGNVATHLSAGVNVRAGFNLPGTFGPGAIPAPIGPTIRSSANSNGDLPKVPVWGLHLFAGAEGRLVGRNIFLDGNTWRNSHSVDKELLVSDLKGGMALRLRKTTIAYTYIYRTKEFTLQPKSNQFGSISIQVGF